MSDGPKPYIDELNIDCNAEIKELKDEIALKHEMLKSLEQQCKDKDALITELADALDWWAKHKDYDPEFAVELKKRAREATR